MSFLIFEYSKISIYILISLLLAFIIAFFSLLIGIYNPDAEKMSTYECGFEPYEDARNTFDVRFYMVAIIFLVFDLETVFFIPWVSSVSLLNTLSIWGMLDFLLELVVGYFYIWALGGLEW